MHILPSAGSIFSYERDLNFTFNVSKFEPTLTTIQMKFSTPGAISTEKISD